jgi:segregation and condensation protein A
MFEININEYQGPLDVLLDLIRKKRLDITMISLAEVADDFINYYNESNHDIEITTEFLEIVTILLRIKQKALFPSEEDDFKDEDVILLEKLFTKQYYTILADLLDQWQLDSLGYFSKGNPLTLEDINLDPKEHLDDINLLKLSVAFNYLLDKKPEVPEYNVDRYEITVSQQIEWIKNKVANSKVSLSEIIKNMPNKYSAVVTFLAILECIRQEIINIIALDNNDFLIIGSDM